MRNTERAPTKGDSPPTCGGVSIRMARPKSRDGGRQGQDNEHVYSNWSVGGQCLVIAEPAGRRSPGVMRRG
jgi:hypothetical protein